MRVRRIGDARVCRVAGIVLVCDGVVEPGKGGVGVVRYAVVGADRKPKLANCIKEKNRMECGRRKAENGVKRRRLIEQGTRITSNRIAMRAAMAITKNKPK